MNRLRGVGTRGAVSKDFAGVWQAGDLDVFFRQLLDIVFCKIPYRVTVLSFLNHSTAARPSDTVDVAATGIVGLDPNIPAVVVKVKREAFRSEAYGVLCSHDYWFLKSGTLKY